MKNKGFTLLEIIVVVGIITLLISVGTISYSSVEKKARDTKRKTDLQEIQAALETYYSSCGFVYPSPTGTNILGEPIICNTNTIMNRIPKDPKTEENYLYGWTDGSDYSICVDQFSDGSFLESEPLLDYYCLPNRQ